jgi:hypothetical protein
VFTKDVDIKLGYRQNSERRYITDKSREAKICDAQAVISSPIRKGRVRTRVGNKLRARHVPALKKLTVRPLDGMNRALQTLNTDGKYVFLH